MNPNRIPAAVIVAVVTVQLLASSTVGANETARVDHGGLGRLDGIPRTLGGPPPKDLHPRARADALKILGGAAITTVGLTVLHPRKRTVPREGLDPNSIGLGLDRGEIRPISSPADRASDRMLAASVLYPRLQTFLTARSGEREAAQLRSVWLQLESALFTTAVTSVAKVAFSRARPFTYLYVYDRTDYGPHWGSSDQTFESFPSGHASLSWAAAMSGVGFMAVERPDLPASRHFWGGLVGGALATSASLLRVEAGTHFPTDVAAGAALGGVIGITVPFAHASGDATGRGGALRAALLGVAAGSVIAALLTPPTSPFFDPY